MAGVGGFLAGAIVGKLVLDKTGWNDAISSVTKDEGKFHGIADRMNAKTKTIGTVFSVAGAAVVGGLMAITKSAADTGERINNLSVKTGIAAETLSGYSLACDHSETSLEGLGIGLRFLSKNMGESTKAGSEQEAIFKSIGVSTTDLSGNMRPLNDVFLDVAERFKGMDDGAQKMTLSTQIFGKAGAELIPLLNLGREGLMKEREEAERLGLVWSQQAAQGADEFGDKLKSLQLSVKGSFQTLAIQAMPVLQKFIEGVTSVIAKVTSWMKAHPGLTDVIVKTALGLGSLMAVVGPLLLMLPKIVAGFDSVKKLGTGLAGQFKNLGGEVSGLSGILGKLPAIGLAAFAGWEIGKAIGNVKLLGASINEHITNAFDWAFKKVGLFNGAAAETGLRAEMIAKATDLSGRSVKNLGDAVDILREQYKKTGDVGIKAALDQYDAWEKEQGGLQKAAVAADTKKIKVIDLNKVMEEAKKAAEAQAAAEEKWTNYLKSEGIVTLDEKSKRIDELNGWIARLNELYRKGQIDVIAWGTATKKAKDEIEGLKIGVTQIVTPARNMTDIMKKVPGTFDKATEAVYEQKDALDYWSDELKVSPATIKVMCYELARLQLAFAGITLPDLTIDPAPLKSSVDASKNYWDGLMNDITSSWGSTLQKLMEGDISFKDFVKETWSDIKTAFFRMISEMVAEWLIKGIGSLISGAATGAAGVASSMTTAGTAVGGLGTIVAGVATSIATVLTTLATAVATTITTIAAALGTGVAALATGVSSAIVAVATGIAAAIDILAAAVPGLLAIGLAAAAIYGAFKLVGAVAEGIGSLFGGGGKNADITRELVPMKWFLKEIRDWAYLIIGPLMYQDYWDIFQEMRDYLRQDDAHFWGIRDLLQHISAMSDVAVDLLKRLPSAQTGAVINEPSLIVAGEQAPRIPEVITPLPDYLAAVNRGGGGTRNVNVSLSASFNINAFDAGGVRDAVRSQIGPQFIEWLRANLGKTVLKEALGV